MDYASKKSTTGAIIALVVMMIAAIFPIGIAYAQSSGSTGDDLITKFGTYIVNPLLLVIFAAGFFMFMYGLLEYMIKAGSSEDTSEGKRHMIYGTLGMFIMVSVYGIISLLDSTFGLNISNPSANTNANVPTINLTGQ
jgi:hypothetical protein